VRGMDVKACSVFLFLIFQTLPAFGAGVDSVPGITPQALNSMLTMAGEAVIFDARGGISKEKDPVVMDGAAKKRLTEIYRGEGLPLYTDRGRSCVLLRKVDCA